MSNLYRPLLPLVSLLVACHLQKIGGNRSWSFAMGLKVFHVQGTSYTVELICYFTFYRAL